MNDIRAKFEEIWPVPDVIMWSEYIGRYIPMHDEVLQYERLNEQWAHEHNARLDTFTRCQETMAPVLSLVDELTKDLEWINEKNEDHYLINQIDRAKQVMEKYK
jgi:hypothetical protein